MNDSAPPTTGIYRKEFRLAECVAADVRELAGVPQAADALQRICLLAVQRVETCEHAAVTLVDGQGRIIGAVSPSKIGLALAEIQGAMEEGPLLDCLRSDALVASQDLGSDSRWPAFGPEAGLRTGVRSVLLSRLSVGGRTHGVLSLYSCEAGAFARDSAGEQWARLFATHAALVLDGVQTHQSLEAALESRGNISVAIGILMARRHLTRPEAFAALRGVAQRMNVKLRDVALMFADGQHPDGRPSAGPAGTGAGN